MDRRVWRALDDFGLAPCAVGRDDLTITGIAMLNFVRPGDLCYLEDPDASDDHLADVTVICPRSHPTQNPDLAYIQVDHPKLAFYHVSSLFADNRQFDRDAALEAAFPGATLGVNCEIGVGVTIHPGAVIRSNTTLGDGVSVESGTVIGSTGLLWTPDPRDGRKVMLQLSGSVSVGVGTYLCANIAIVRGACRETTALGEGVMIAPGSAIGHGAVIGDGVHFANNVAIGGSAVVEDDCFIGSSATVQPGIQVPAGSVVGAGAVLAHDYRERAVFAGVPAKPIRDVVGRVRGVPTQPGTTSSDH